MIKRENRKRKGKEKTERKGTEREKKRTRW